MANTITAGNGTNNGLAVASDATGALNILTGSGSGTAAISIDSSQNVTVAGSLAATGGIVGALKSGTVNAGGTNPFPSSSGPTSVDFTGIPSTVKRITVIFSGVSTSGTSSLVIRIGTSSGIETTDYLGSTVVAVSGAANTGSTVTAGFSVNSNPAAAAVIHGTVTLYSVGSNLWVSSSALGLSNAAQAIIGGGSKTLSGTLDRLRITTIGGSDTFDLGSINIIYE
jgi:hypothetical protein